MSNEVGETWGDQMVDYGVPWSELDDKNCWVDGDQRVWDWEELTTAHLGAIVKGKARWGSQSHKLNRAKKELSKRFKLSITK